MPAAASSEAALRQYTQWIYALHAASLLGALIGTGSVAVKALCSVPSVVAVVMNYARRRAVAGTWLASHFRWQLRTFWFALLWMAITLAVSMPLVLLVVGIFLAWGGLAMIGAWVCYRVLRGWLALRRAEPMPGAPRT